MTRILVTGFEPFGDEPVNPSQAVLAELQALELNGVTLQTRLLPTCFGTAMDRIEAALTAWPVDAVLSLGLAGGRSGLSVERVAINLEDARIADNAGLQPVDQPVVAGAPAAYFSTLPVKAMVAAIRGVGVEASVSHTAGTFVCNHVFFATCHLAATRWPGLRCGFVHVPWLPEQGVRHGGPAMEAASMARGVAAAVLAIHARDPEPGVSEGSLS